MLEVMQFIDYIYLNLVVACTCTFVTIFLKDYVYNRSEDKINTIIIENDKNNSNKSASVYPFGSKHLMKPLIL